MDLHFIFQECLADKLKGKVFVDIGSRLGAALFMVFALLHVKFFFFWCSLCSLSFVMKSLQGHTFSKAKKLIGIEKNIFFCDLQTELVNKFRMKDRIQVAAFFFAFEPYFE
jgi:hypothetical protein